MRLCGTGALALSQGLSSCPARPKSATGHGARLTVSATSSRSLCARNVRRGVSGGAAWRRRVWAIRRPNSATAVVNDGRYQDMSSLWRLRVQLDPEEDRLAASGPDAGLTLKTPKPGAGQVVGARGTLADSTTHAERAIAAAWWSVLPQHDVVGLHRRQDLADRRRLPRPHREP